MLKHVRLVAILFIGAALLATTGSPLIRGVRGSARVGYLTGTSCGGELPGSGWLDSD